MPDINFEQFGAFAIVCALLLAALLWAIRELNKERTRNELIQDKRLQEAKDSRDQLVEPITKMTSLTQQIYDAIIIRNNRSS